MGVINKVVVKGVTYDIEDKINKEELLKRLQGTSENSNAMTDPFKYIGASNSVELVNALNNTLSNGRYRVRLGNILLDLDVFVTSAADIAQLLRGFVTPIDDGWTTSLQYNEYHRIYHNGAWGSWENIAGKNVKDLLSQNTQDIVGLQEQINNIDGVESVDITPETTEVLLKVNDKQATFPAATAESAGVMSAVDKKIVNGIDAAIKEGEKRALRRLFIAAGALYNDSSADITRTAPWDETVTHKTGHYYLNGLGDITEEQMAVIYNEKEALNNIDRQRGNQYFKSRTLLFPSTSQTVIRDYYIKVESLQMTWANCLSLEILRLANIPLNSNAKTNMLNAGNIMRYTFYKDANLRIIFPIDVSSTTSIASTTFEECTSLTELRVFGLKVNLTLDYSPSISKDSVLYIINNASPTSAKTITLHPDAYARLADDAEIVAALEAQPLVTLVSA